MPTAAAGLEQGSPTAASERRALHASAYRHTAAGRAFRFTSLPLHSPVPSRTTSLPHHVLRFIKWTQETFSAGGHKAELLPLLERCTRELQGWDGGRYARDIRYLRVWIQYVSRLLGGQWNCGGRRASDRRGVQSFYDGY